jgi:hypothetical protein
MPFRTSMVHRGIDHAPNLNETSVAGALHYTTDVRVDQITAKRPQWRERPVLVSASRLKPTTSSAANIAASARASVSTQTSSHCCRVRRRFMADFVAEVR